MDLARFFRSRAAEHERTAMDLIVAQDEIRRLLAENAELNLRKESAEQDARQARERVTDWLAERMFGKPIYGTSPSLAASDQPTVEQSAAAFAPRRKQARQLAREMEAKFFEAAGMYEEPQPDPQAQVYENAA